MYKLLIVEDEPLIRAGLKQYFEWEELGFTEIIEAENGKVGIEVALREQPHLVITDISMPELDGLDMISYLQPSLPETIFVILTGYNDFQYAKRAIQIGNVFEYLLKPLQYEESLHTIQSCIDKINSREEEKRLKLLNEQAGSQQTFDPHQLVKHLVEGEPIDDKMISSIREKYNLEDYTYYAYVMKNIPEPTTYIRQHSLWKTEAIELMMNSYLAHITTPAHVLLSNYYFKDKLYFAIFYHVDIEIPHHVIEKEINERLKKIDEAKHVTLFASCSNPCRDLIELQQAYKLTEQLLNQRFFHSYYLYSSRNIQLQQSSLSSVVQMEDKDKYAIQDFLEQKNLTQIEELMEQFAQRVAYTTPNVLLAFVQELISVTVRFAHRHNIQLDGIYNERLFDLSFMDDFYRLEDMFQWIGKWIYHLSEVYMLQKDTQDDIQVDSLFRHIEEYIIQHINEDVSLQMVADKFFYNPSYLSRLFKTKLNQSFSSFITEIRIRFAQRCLQKPENLITDVCNMCGYKSYKHFVKTFKSVTRMTPSEYRKQLGL